MIAKDWGKDLKVSYVHFYAKGIAHNGNDDLHCTACEDLDFLYAIATWGEGVYVLHNNKAWVHGHKYIAWFRKYDKHWYAFGHRGYCFGVVKGGKRGFKTFLLHGDTRRAPSGAKPVKSGNEGVNNAPF